MLKGSGRIVICHQWFRRWWDKCAIYRPRTRRREMEKHFRQQIEKDEKENHRKCDNKNEIYELRLVIYLCANLLLQKEKAMKTKRGRVRHYYVTSEKKKVFKKNLFHAAKWQTIDEKNYRKENGNFGAWVGTKKCHYILIKCFLH